jgi:hypothetical protein
MMTFTRSIIARCHDGGTWCSRDPEQLPAFPSVRQWRERRAYQVRGSGISASTPSTYRAGHQRH